MTTVRSVHADESAIGEIMPQIVGILGRTVLMSKGMRTRTSLNRQGPPMTTVVLLFHPNLDASKIGRAHV